VVTESMVIIECTILLTNLHGTSQGAHVWLLGGGGGVLEGEEHGALRGAPTRLLGCRREEHGTNQEVPTWKSP
jgi:hypothetical protein